MRRSSAGCDISRHASSYTTHRCPPAGSRRADSIHADAHVISTEMSVAFSVTRDRSREIIGRRRVEPHRARPIEEPGQVAGHEPTQRVTDQSTVLGQPTIGVRRPSGERSRSTTIGSTGTSAERTVSARATSIAVCSSGVSRRSSTVSASAPTRSRRRAVTCAAHCDVVEPGWSVALVERVEPVGHAVPERDGLARRRLRRRRCARPSGRRGRRRGDRTGSTGCRGSSPAPTCPAPTIPASTRFGAVMRPRE